MSTSNSLYNTIGVPIGNSIAILIIATLTCLHIRTFQSRKLSKQMKLSSVLVFMALICYDITQIFQKSVIPNRHCNIGKAFSFTSFFLSRAALYYFFIIRIQVSFIDSELECSPTLLRALKAITFTVYFSTALFYAVTFNHWSYDATHQRCWPSNDTVLMINFIVSILYGVTDLLLGVVLCTLYLYRLYALFKIMKASYALDPAIKQDGNSNETLLRIIKKQAKLAYIAYVTTLFIIVIGPPLGFNYCCYVDSVVSALCVYCTFDLNQRVYQYLCNCGGNKVLLCVCCALCCCCCNEPSDGMSTNSATDQKSTSTSVEV